jgi:hypothetical protein
MQFNPAGSLVPDEENCDDGGRGQEETEIIRKRADSGHKKKAWPVKSPEFFKKSFFWGGGCISYFTQQ